MFLDEKGEKSWVVCFLVCMLTKKVVFFLGVCCLFVSFLPVTAAANVFEDGKFSFTWEKSSTKSNVYQATVKRKDNDFINFDTVFIYNIRVKNVNDYHPKILTKFIILSKGEQSKSVNESLGELIFCSFKQDSYGIKFPQYEDMDGPLPDAAFNLDLKLYDPWYTIENPNIMYSFYNRYGKSFNCSVTLTRTIRTTHKNNIEDQWTSFTLKNGETEANGNITQNKDMTGFSILNENEYYLQFS